MKTVAFVTQKGGTGKSTLAVALAVEAQAQGQTVHVIDLDPQATVRAWRQRREAESPDVVGVQAAQLEATLARLRRKKVDLVLIDTPGADSPGTTAAMGAADLCLIPARPSIADIEATRPTVASLMKLGTPFAFVLNQCPPGPARTTDAFRALALVGAVADATMRNRVDYLDAMAAGQGPTERAPNGAAAREVRDLLQWIETRLSKGKTNGKKVRVA